MGPLEKEGAARGRSVSRLNVLIDITAAIADWLVLVPGMVLEYTVTAFLTPRALSA
jgi:hypothetical protein